MHRTTTIAIVTKFRSKSQWRKSFYFQVGDFYLVVVVLDVRLFVDGEEISLNKFVVKILGGTLVGAVSALRGVKENWKEIKIEIRR